MCVQYEGRGYAGWQRQPDRPSVQAALESALSAVAGKAVQVHCAGRTDSGVHAFAQIASFDTDARRSPRAWVLGTNSNLPDAVSLSWAQAVPEAFDARFSAQARRYRYLIWNDAARAGLLAGRATWVTWPLDVDAMHEAAQVLRGEQDFSAFRAAECQSRTPMRCVFEVKVWRQGAFVVTDIRANAFLQHMVRNIVGSLVEVGRGRRPAAWLSAVLRGGDRRQAGPTAAPDGLYFVGPEYASTWGLPALPEPWLP
ncbi:MAG TPA: tRNA pseudouridine(38-40) synthase TruA [Nevskiaceae bacterium]